MNDERHRTNFPPFVPEPPGTMLVDVMPEFLDPRDATPNDAAPPLKRWVWRPAILFVVTCASTFAAGFIYNYSSHDRWQVAALDGLMYCGAVMTILVCHEMGHFLQALRYGVYASYPFFIPMPFTPIGTLGAVIVMDSRHGDRKAVFDIGISGPLAGLIPTFFFLWLGLTWSHVAWIPPGVILFGDPPLVKLFTHWIFGPLPPGFDVVLHPLGFAGWVGLLITSLNLMPIGQLDGGHILYTMLRRNAHAVAVGVFMLAIFFSIRLHLYHWLPMLGLLAFMGIRHPPTADDSVPLGLGRHILGWLTLAFIALGFTPVPIGQ